MRVGATALACWLAACSSGKPQPSTSSFAQRFADGGSCPPASAPGLPSGSGCVTSVAADLDGNGTSDRFLVYARLADGTPTSWWARALLSGSSPTPPARLPAGEAVGGTSMIYPRVAGATQANTAPGDEVFVQLSADLFHGAAPPIDAIYDVRDGHVVPVTSNGKLFTFSTGGISRFGSGARCDGDRVFTLTHVEIEPNGWTWSDHRYTWNGTELVAGGRSSGHLPPVLISNPRVYRNFELICGPLRLSQVTDSYPKP